MARAARRRETRNFNAKDSRGAASKKKDKKKLGRLREEPVRPRRPRRALPHSPQERLGFVPEEVRPQQKHEGDELRVVVREAHQAADVQAVVPPALARRVDF